MKFACFYGERFKVGAAVLFGRKNSHPGGVIGVHLVAMIFLDKALVIIGIEGLCLLWN